ncbi:hypothetical protein BDV37DRAFT_248537 [Aspergillus pseudonomiae]|uniref:Uncharacterized protein n=1 Tax=Aspergillus pseudonomiae TaxID=1506151 RepID=A0A5N7DE26_9EURO|nr:uncharacterized protein BDV37DRAFT_248537 [Aspergillus pseudonomiae]KAE8403988.1 hypothetical protein BDV37DRAFT_248537 [Aspergillus pseudonomiae]
MPHWQRHANLYIHYSTTRTHSSQPQEKSTRRKLIHSALTPSQTPSMPKKKKNTYTQPKHSSDKLIPAHPNPIFP